MQTFMVNINNEGWNDFKSEGIQDLQKEINEYLDGPYDEVVVITEDLNFLTFGVISMYNRFSWKRKGTL